MWFFGDDYGDEDYYQILVKYDGAFTVFNGKDIPLINDIRWGNSSAIFPVPGWDGLYFGCWPGYIEFSAGQWQQRFIEINGGKFWARSMPDRR